MIHQIDPVIDPPIPMPPVAIDPMPPVVVDPMPPQISCPPVCMIYCENGNQLDQNGCPTCICNDELPSPVTDQDCVLEQPSCNDYEQFVLKSLKLLIAMKVELMDIQHFNFL